MKRNRKKILSVVLALSMVLSMNTGVFADTVSTDGGDGIKTEDREEGAKAGETVSEEATVSGEEVPEEPAVISSDLAEEKSGEAQFPAPGNLCWITTTQDIDVGGGKTVKAKGGSISFGEVDGADTISWWVKKGDTVVVSGDAVYDPNDQINTVIVEDFLWNSQEAGEYRAYAKTKGKDGYADSDEIKSVLWVINHGDRYGQLKSVSFNDNGEYGVYFERFRDSHGYIPETQVDGFCIEYSYEDKGKKQVLYYGTYDYRSDDVYLIPGTVNFDDEAARAKVHIEAVKAAKERGIKEVDIRVCSLSYILDNRHPSEWSNPIKADFTDLIAIYEGIPEKLEIMGNPAKLGIGRSVQLGLRAFPDGIGSFSVSWCSLNPDLASVDRGGKVTGLKEGTAVISVNSVSNPNAVSSCRIEIEPVRLQRISFDKQSYEMFPGQTGVTPKIIFDPADAPNKELYFSSSDPEVAEMSGKENRLIAYKSGKATITATSKANPSISANCTVTVSGRAGKIIDSGSGKMYDWTLYEGGTLVVRGNGCRSMGSAKPWADYLNDITELELEGYFYALDGAAFYDMPVLRSVTLPESFEIRTKTGYFHNCPMLETINYTGTQYAVENGNVLTGMPLKSKSPTNSILLGTKTATSLPGDVGRIGPWAFYGQALPYVTIPSNISSIAITAFNDCKQLTFLVIENPVLTLEGEAFAGCTNLKDVFFAGSEKDWKKLSGRSKVLKSVNVHYNSSMPELCTVSFNSNGGTGAASQSVIKGNSIPELPTVYKDKYVLEGWYTDQALTQPFKEGETKVEGNMFLYAKWRDAKQLTVIFYGRGQAGGSWEEFDRQTVYETQYVDAKTPSYADITADFAGWYTDEKLKKGFNTRTKRITEDLCTDGVLKLYAKWSSLTPAERQTELSEGVTLSYDIEYTSSVSYDGRAHVVGEYGGKILKKESASVNPDIFVENFCVYLNGEELSGITIKSFNYKNNTLPSNDGARNSDIPMFIYPVLNYDNKDERLKEVLNSNKNLKKVLGQMMKPTVITKGEEKGQFNYEPLTVTISRIQLSSDTECYTKADLKNDKSLNTKDGILVWNGGKIKYTTKKIKHNEDGEVWYDVYYLKATIPGLYYQRVFNINGKPKVKKINLRPGSWAFKTVRYREDGETWVEYEFPMQTTAFDYYLDSASEGSPANIILNDSTWDGTEDDEGNVIKSKIKSGYFTGTLPSFPQPDEE